VRLTLLNEILSQVGFFELRRESNLSDATHSLPIGNWSDDETMLMEKFGKDLTLHRVKYGMLKR